MTPTPLTIAQILALSPFLANLAQQFSAQAIADANLTDVLQPNLPTELTALMPALRHARAQAMLRIALADLGGVINLPHACAALSSFADYVVQHTFNALIQREIRLNRLTHPQQHGIFVLAMGKWGAGELNYSSDIDFVVFFEPDHAPDPDLLARSAVIVTKELIRLLSERTADGPCFRTDLRLRPDPSSMKAAVSTIFAENYYQKYGRTWERAAYLKARFVAGDCAAAARFLQMVQGFVRRSSVDFAVVDDIADIKQRIRAQYGDGVPQSDNINVKLCAGGIRDIELHVQTLQLLCGRRQNALYTPQTLAAARALQQADRLPAHTLRVFERAYPVLRRIEHAAQLLNDEQTHFLPAAGAQASAILRLAGFTDPTQGHRQLKAHLWRVVRADKKLFPTTSASAQWPLHKFTDGELVRRTVRAWPYGRLKFALFERDRRIIAQATPVLLQVFAQCHTPDAAFMRCNRFLESLNAGIHLLQQFVHMPEAAQCLAQIFDAAPLLADMAAADPALWELLHDTPEPPTLKEPIRRAQLRIALSVWNGQRTATQAAQAYTALAAQWLTHSNAHAPLLFIGQGSLGACEMHLASDIDALVLCAQPSTANSVRDLLHYVAQRDVFGPFYQVDWRLRPDGSDAPPICGVDYFLQYHRTRARTWEKAALLRARPLSDDPQGVALLQDAWRHRADAAQLQADLVAMRQQVQHNRQPQHAFDVKLLAGGLTDLQLWIAQQALCADIAPQWHNADAAGRTAHIIDLLAQQGVLLPEVAQELQQANAFYLALQQAQAIFVLSDSAAQGWRPLFNMPATQHLAAQLAHHTARVQHIMADGA